MQLIVSDNLKSVREVFSVETYTLGAHSVDVHEGEVERGSSSDVEEMSSDELDDDAPEPPLHSRGELAPAQADDPFCRRLRRYMELQRRIGLCGLRGSNRLKTMVCYVYA